MQAALKNITDEVAEKARKTQIDIERKSARQRLSSYSQQIPSATSSLQVTTPKLAAARPRLMSTSNSFTQSTETLTSKAPLSHGPPDQRIPANNAAAPQGTSYADTLRAAQPSAASQRHVHAPSTKNSKTVAIIARELHEVQFQWGGRGTKFGKKKLKW